MAVKPIGRVRAKAQVRILCIFFLGVGVFHTLVRSRILYSPSKPLSRMRFADTVTTTKTIRSISK